MLPLAGVAGFGLVIGWLSAAVKHGWVATSASGVLAAGVLSGLPLMGPIVFAAAFGLAWLLRRTGSSRRAS